jgi:SAM-dependent methyltransferase
MKTPKKPNNFDWKAYYNRVAKNPPRETVLKAIEFFEQESKENLSAVDLGCGSGRDTKALLEKGWSVLAIDGEKKGIDLLKKDIQNIYSDKIKTEVFSFQNLQLEKQFDLINSAYALPFCPPDYFPKLWSKIIDAIKIGGRFSGQLFGLRDSWNRYDDMNFHSKEQVNSLLTQL